ncbi:MAG: hypothetical protein ACRDYE_11245, partial [Acidimicrobiales bacterium]
DRTMKQDLEWRSVLLAAAVVAAAALVSVFVGRTIDAPSHTMSFSATMPTAFNLQPAFFCTMLQQSGGL